MNDHTTISINSIKEALNDVRRVQLLELAGKLEEKGITGLKAAIEEKGIPNRIYASPPIFFIVRAAFGSMDIKIHNSPHIREYCFILSWDTTDLEDFTVEIGI